MPRVIDEIFPGRVDDQVLPFTPLNHIVKPPVTVGPPRASCEPEEAM
jgi:hypothetical protein